MPPPPPPVAAAVSSFHRRHCPRSSPRRQQFAAFATDQDGLSSVLEQMCTEIYYPAAQRSSLLLHLPAWLRLRQQPPPMATAVHLEWTVQVHTAAYGALPGIAMLASAKMHAFPLIDVNINLVSPAGDDDVKLLTAKQQIERLAERYGNLPVHIRVGRVSYEQVLYQLAIMDSVRVFAGSEHTLLQAEQAAHALMKQQQQKPPKKPSSAFRRRFS